MRVTWFPRLSRHSQFGLLGLGVALVLLLGPVTSAVTQEPQKPAFALQGDAGLIFLYVKAEKAADFEALMGRFKEALAKAEAPEAKQQAASLKLLKAVSGPAPSGSVLYLLLADPAVKNVEYWFLPVLYKAFPAEAQSFLDKWQDVKHTNQAAWDLQAVLKMQ
jgi:hypothetical protein